MFTVTVDQPYTGSLGLQPPGTFTVLGGSDGDAQDNLGQAPFAVIVTPEPGTAVLLGLALTLTFVRCKQGQQNHGEAVLPGALFDDLPDQMAIRRSASRNGSAFSTTP